VPVYRSRAILEVARGIKAFLNLETGLTRGEVPGFGQKPKPARNRVKKDQGRNNQAIKRLQEQISSKDQQLRVAYQQLADSTRR
jgi:hypothetical protein